MVAPALPFWLEHRARRGKEIAARLPERFGDAVISRPAGRLVWVHAASLGETMSALALIEALAGSVNVLLTTGTTTSAALAQARARAIHQFVPLDTPDASRKFLDHWRPDAAVMLESEIWPNLLEALDTRRIPRFLFNARLSARSAARWARAPGAVTALFGGFRVIAAQSAGDARVVRALGLERVVDWGNLKFAVAPLPDDAVARAVLEAAMPGPRVLAASTHAGEDWAVIEAHRPLAARHAGLVSIIVPRHPERAGAIAALATGLDVALRSRGEMPVAGGIYIADTLGELGVFYRLCPIAFIGGSLVPRGGHTMIEAAQLGCAVVTGPHIANHAEAAAVLREAGALIDVADGAGLAGALGLLLADPARVRAMGASGRAACDRAADLPGRLAATVLEALA